MPMYYLKNAAGDRIYRLVYEEILTIPSGEPSGRYRVLEAFVTDDANPALPDGTPITEVDQAVTIGQVLVDMILSPLVAATVSEYRTIVSSVASTSWT